MHTSFRFNGNQAHLQLFLIRVYIGLDFIRHFDEKFGWLGLQDWTDVLHYFQTLGYADPRFMVRLAGLCEFGAFVGFTFGLCTRLAAVGTALYLIITLFSGGHQHFGFLWVNAGGGWEFPAFWAFLCLTFVLTGGGRWSLDAVIHKRLPFGTPVVLRKLFA